MFDNLRKRFFWDKMYSDVRKFVAGCLTCRRRKPVRPKRAGFLQPMVAEAPGEVVHWDALGPFPKSENGYKYIITFMDGFSNWPDAIPVKDIKASTTAKVLLKYISSNSCPIRLISDNGSNFAGKVMEELTRLLGVKQRFTSAWHPQSNGKVERLHRFMSNVGAKGLPRLGHQD